MPASTLREYTDAFQTEAVRLVSESGLLVAQIAWEPGIPDNELPRWVSGQRHAHAQWTTLAILCKELATLKRENVLLRQGRDFHNVRRRSSLESPNEIPHDPGARPSRFQPTHIHALAVLAAGY